MKDEAKFRENCETTERQLRSEINRLTYELDKSRQSHMARIEELKKDWSDERDRRLRYGVALEQIAAPLTFYDAVGERNMQALAREALGVPS